MDYRTGTAIKALESNPFWTELGTDEVFDQSLLPTFNLKELRMRAYYVFSQDNQPVKIDAGSVVEALQLSKIKDPLKVERSGFRLHSVIRGNELSFYACIEEEDSKTHATLVGDKAE